MGFGLGSRMQIVLATNNKHKVHEFGLIDSSVEFLTPSSFGVPADAAWEETGATFFENAFGKAQFIHEFIFKLTGRVLPVVADDSGICVAALGGRPGLYSVRYGADSSPPARTDADRNRLLLSELEGLTDRRAHYVCALVAYLGRDAWLAAQSIWEGQVAQEETAGGTGFGYDPVVIVQPWNRPVSTLSEAEKAANSHRARAWQALKPSLVEVLRQGAGRA